MRITIEYFAQAREAAGVLREVIEIESGTAQEVVAQQAQKHGGRLAKLLLSDSPGELHLASSVLLAVGDVQVRPHEPYQLQAGDEILVIPPVAGG